VSSLFGCGDDPLVTPPVATGHNYFTEMSSASKAGSYLKLKEFVYHSTLGWIVIKKKKGHFRG
jgi:hypothetical protein